jgi:hypothetical protein
MGETRKATAIVGFNAPPVGHRCKRGRRDASPGRGFKRFKVHFQPLVKINLEPFPCPRYMHGEGHRDSASPKANAASGNVGIGNI